MKERFSSGDGAQKNPFEVSSPALQPVSKKEQEDIVEALPYPNKRRLILKNELDIKPGDIARAGLEPQHRFTFEGRDFAVSTCYRSSRHSRDAVLAFVKEEGDAWRMRTWYASQSHGLWNYVQGEAVGYIQKPKDEEMVRLSLPLQKSLAVVRTMGGKVFDMDDPVEAKRHTLMFAGPSTRNENHETEWETTPQPKKMDRPLNMPPLTSVLKKRLKLREYAEHFDFLKGEKDPHHPDFSRLAMTWEEPSAFHGDVSKEVFPSHDGQFLYLFNRVKSGQAWIAQIECIKSELLSTGIRSKYVMAFPLTIPAWCYPVEYLGFRFTHEELFFRNVHWPGKERFSYPGNSLLSTLLPEKGEYVELFSNYHVHQPVIKRYLEATAHRVPGYRETLEKLSARPVDTKKKIR